MDPHHSEDEVYRNVSVVEDTFIWEVPEQSDSSEENAEKVDKDEEEAVENAKKVISEGESMDTTSKVLAATLQSIQGPYTFTPLNLDTEEMRFLVLEPHHDNTERPLICSMSYSTLANCEPYTSVVNTRGNPLFKVDISINGHGKLVTRNIAEFLLHIRKSDSPTRLWFRDVCLDQTPQGVEERSKYWNPEWMETMSKNAESIIDLSDITSALWDAGKIPRAFPPRPKRYLETTKPTLPNHYPIPLGSCRGWDSWKINPPHHRYLPLDYVADEIRLISLWKANNFSDPLYADFAYTPMDDDEVAYHGVSYTWGQEESSHEILLNGQLFFIRKNLDSFLRFTRHTESKTVLWIDAICIDQNNIAERNRQISRMLEIYDAADIVLSWVGEPDEASLTAFDLIKDLEEHVTLSRNDDGSWDVNRSEEFPSRLAALYRFLQRPYFRRIWIIQELAGSSHPTISCGKDFLGWSALDKAAYHLIDVLYRDRTMRSQMIESDPCLDSVEDRDLMFMRRLFYFRHLRVRGADESPFTNDWAKIPKTAPGILDAVVLGRDFDCSVSHDKIFAVWNLAKDTVGMDFNLDYSRSLSQTYLDFASAVSTHTGSLDIICASEPNTGLDIPSWCPDWSTPSRVSSMVRREHIPNTWMAVVNDIGGSIYHAAGQEIFTPRFNFDGNSLKCAGVILDSVRIVGPYEPYPEKRQEMFSKWLSICQKECDFPSRELGLSAFWSMLAGDATGVWTIKEEPLEAGIGSLLTMIPAKKEECKHSTWGAGDIYGHVTRGRRLIITGEGYMGLAPFYVEGQKLAILNRCSSPVILVENEDGTYRFLGSCFVQGWMEGKILERFGASAEDAWAEIDQKGRLEII